MKKREVVDKGSHERGEAKGREKKGGKKIR